MEKTFIEINGIQREVVRVKSKNPAHDGYFTTYRDEMGPDDVEYTEGEAQAEPGTAADPGDPPPAANKAKPPAKPKGKAKK